MRTSKRLAKDRVTGDSLPFNAEDWSNYPAIAEQAYRRGFQQGIAEATGALARGATLADIDAWCYGAIWRWRFGKMRYEIPPAIKFRARKKVQEDAANV